VSSAAALEIPGFEEKRVHCALTSARSEPTRTAHRKMASKPKLAAHSGRMWDIFYRNNANRFFKDRHYLDEEFSALAVAETQPTTIVEIGCGVGNALLPLLARLPFLTAVGFDISKAAVRCVQTTTPPECAGRLAAFQHSALPPPEVVAAVLTATPAAELETSYSSVGTPLHCVRDSERAAASAATLAAHPRVWAESCEPHSASCCSSGFARLSAAAEALLQPHEGHVARACLPHLWAMGAAAHDAASRGEAASSSNPSAEAAGLTGVGRRPNPPTSFAGGALARTPLAGGAASAPLPSSTQSPSARPATQSSGASAPAAAAGFDFCLLMFVLSAVPQDLHPFVLREAALTLKPGSGRLLLRDYCVGDAAAARFGVASRVDENLYVRGDGTLAAFIVPAALAAQAAAAGLVVEELRVVRRRIENRSEGAAFERAWVHAVLRRAGNAAQEAAALAAAVSATQSLRAGVGSSGRGGSGSAAASSGSEKRRGVVETGASCVSGGAPRSSASCSGTERPAIAALLADAGCAAEADGFRAEPGSPSTPSDAAQAPLPPTSVLDAVRLMLS